MESVVCTSRFLTMGPNLPPNPHNPLHQQPLHNNHHNREVTTRLLLKDILLLRDTLLPPKDILLRDTTRPSTINNKDTTLLLPKDILLRRDTLKITINNKEDTILPQLKDILPLRRDTHHNREATLLLPLLPLRRAATLLPVRAAILPLSKDTILLHHPHNNNNREATLLLSKVIKVTTFVHNTTPLLSSLILPL